MNKEAKIIAMLIVLALVDLACAQWLEQVKLTASDGAAEALFGASVSTDGDYCIVGAYNADNDNAKDSGSAYIFKRDGTSWFQQARITASDVAFDDRFAFSASISGEYAIVGAPWDDYNGRERGSAYIFKRDGETWIEHTKLIPSDSEPWDEFGVSVSISGDYAIVGADEDDDNGSRSGSAYIFRRDGESWFEQTKLTASDGDIGDTFGSSCSISGDYVIVGAQYDEDRGEFSGSSYIFKREGANWLQQAKLTASDGAAEDVFGFRVSISGDYAIVSSHSDDDDGDRSGSAYIFKRDGESWIEQAKLTASDGAAGDHFGVSVSIYQDYAAVGAHWDDDNGNASGSAYIFRRNGAYWIEQTKLTASDGAAIDRFGLPVCISSNYVIVGAAGDDDNGSWSGSAYVFAYEGPPMLVGLEITGPVEARQNCEAQCVAIAYYDNNSTSDVTEAAHWWVEPNIIASIDENGLLSTTDINAPEIITIYAEYTEESVTIEAEIAVNVTFAKTLHVPADYLTIQAAIDAAKNCDTVVVADGVYTGEGNRDIDFKGKAITVRSENGPENCVIDCQNSGCAFYFDSGEGTNSIVEGFTITNGYEAEGGGIFCDRSSPTITNCTIIGNTAEGNGGGVYCIYGSPTITNCTISENSAGNGGGGIYCSHQNNSMIINCTIAGNSSGHNGGGIGSHYSGKPSITNCKLSENSSQYGGGVGCLSGGSLAITNCVFSGNSARRGGGICCIEPDINPIIINCTVSGNLAEEGGGAIYNNSSSPTLINSILCGNEAPEGSEIYLERHSNPWVSYTDVQSGEENVYFGPNCTVNWGLSNIDADPCFIQPGYWDANGIWVVGDYHLLPTSPCIDTGDPNYIPEPNETDLDGNPRVSGDAIDMGAYEAIVSCFGINEVKIKTEAGKKDDDIKIKGTFNPGVPIDLMIDDVMYTIDDGLDYMLTFLIPAGSFKLEGKGDKDKYKFHSPKGSVPDIKAKFDFDKCKFEFKAKKVAGIDEITRTSLKIILQAGANIAQEIVELEVKGKKGEHLEYKRKPKFECCPEM